MGHFNLQKLSAFSIIFILVSLFFGINSAWADSYLNPVATIMIDRDSAYLGIGWPAGDFNGDGLSDLLAITADLVSRPKAYIYFGANPPDTICDWNYIY